MPTPQQCTSTLAPALCPLLSAVWPLRYAIGPTLAVDTSAYGLPPLQGFFPDLGEETYRLGERPLNYTARLLRDGWLYVWQSSMNKLVEYRVEKAIFSQTPRAGKVIDGRSLPYLLLPAGEKAGLSWSPSQWSDEQFAAAKKNAKVRQRVMREITPGAAPFSGKASSIHERTGDYMDALYYGWSSEPSTRHRPDYSRLLDDMRSCEQQAYALIDDPWGVLLDLAGLVRARQGAFETLRKKRSDDWAVAGVLKSLADSDSQIKSQLPSITEQKKLTDTWHEHGKEETTYANDIRRLSGLWADWFNTLAQRGPASLDSACGHFDITQPAARQGLEQHFAVACLGPSATSLGAKTLEKALTPEQQPGQPWLLWALLGVAKRTSVGDINSLVGLADGIKENGGKLVDETGKFTRALTLSTLLNQAADRLNKHSLAPATEGLFTALAPVAGAGLHHANEGLKAAGQVYLAASLARSQQRLAVAQASHKQVGEWLSDLMGTRLKAPPAKLKLTPVAGAVQKALPFFHLVPAPAATQATGKLAPLTGALAADASLRDLLSLGKGALNNAPLKCVVALMAGVNFAWSGTQLLTDGSTKNRLSFAAGALGAISASNAVLQKVAEVNWASVVETSGVHSFSSQTALTKALGKSALTAGLQAVVSGFDTLVYGLETLESYQAGDFDTASINGALSLASAANLRIYVQTFRAVRAARAAVIAGEAATLSAGLRVAPHLAAKALGLTILIVGGLVARLYTQDTPLEKWIKGTRFGISPATWSGDYAQTMTELYKVLFPVHFDAYRLNEQNPYRGMVQVTYMMLRLPGKAELTDEMIHFKGEEIWGGLFGFGAVRKAVEWTGKDFDRHAGTRIQQEPGTATYRRVYHRDQQGNELNRLEGKLTYSPLAGLNLPAIDIKDIAWL